MNRKFRRSWLLVPASKPDEVEEAAAAGADAIVLDLVELVAEQDKATARADLRRLVGLAHAGGSDVFIQTDFQSAWEDLRAAMCYELRGIVLARAEAAREIDDVAALLTRLETEHGIAA